MSPNPQCQAHPIPLYESNNYIYYVEGLQSLQWLLKCPWASQQAAIFGSRKNRTNCVTDHTKGLLNETLLLSSLHSCLIACLTPSKFLQEDHRCSGSSRAVLQNRHRLGKSSSNLDRCRPNQPCPVINCMRKPTVGRPYFIMLILVPASGNHCLV